MSYFPRLIVFAAIAAAAQADAAVVVGLVIDPTATAGSSPDVNSIYSGPGTWHLFAVDDNVDDFGISTYNIHLSGATAFRHTSPLGSIQDGDGNVQQAGFNILRTSPGQYANDSIHASQPLPDQSPFLFTGLGQETGNLAAKVAAAQPGSTLLNGATSPGWGTYNSISPLEGKNWLFLAEGTYDSGVLPTISEAAFTVFTSPTTFRSSFSTTAIVPEPITPTLLTREYVDHLTPRPLPNSTPAPVAAPEPEPIVVPAPPVNTPPNPPIANDDPQPGDQPTKLPPPPPYPIYTYGDWHYLSDVQFPTGIDHDAFITIGYQPIDSAVSLMPFEDLDARSHVLQFAMKIELARLLSNENFGDGDLVQVDFAPGLRFASFDALNMGVADQVSIESPVAAPEPASLALVGLATTGLGGILVRRRR